MIPSACPLLLPLLPLPLLLLVLLEPVHAGPLDVTLLPLRTLTSGTTRWRGEVHSVAVAGEDLFIGSRNEVLKVSSTEREKSLLWPANNVSHCEKTRGDKAECANFIRVLALLDDGRLLACGSGAFQPSCRILEEKEDHFVPSSSFEATGIAPFSSLSPSRVLVHNSWIYSLTEATPRLGVDPLLHRRSLLSPSTLGLRSDSKVFSGEVSFAGLSLTRHSVLAWISEQEAGEVSSSVLRVCSQDEGSLRPHSHLFSSLTKAQLQCEVSGAVPLQFHKLVAVAASSEQVFGLFRSLTSGVNASAICAFSVEAIEAVLSQTERRGSTWSPPVSFNASCPTAVFNQEEAQRFQRAFPLVRRLLESTSRDPFFWTLSALSFTALALDSRVAALRRSSFHDVLFVASSKGDVTVLVLIERLAVAVHRLQFSEEKIVSLQLQHGNETRLVVASEQSVWVIPVASCEGATDCAACLGLRSPYCAWDVEFLRCVSVQQWKNREASLVQSVVHLDLQLCQPRERPLPNFPRALSPSSTECATVALVEAGGQQGVSYAAVLGVALLAFLAGACMSAGILLCRYREETKSTEERIDAFGEPQAPPLLAPPPPKSPSSLSGDFSSSYLSMSPSTPPGGGTHSKVTYC